MRLAIVSFLAVSLCTQPLAAQSTTPDPPDSARGEDRGSPSRGRSLTGWSVALEVHASLLTDARDAALLNNTFGYALRGGYRMGGWGAFLVFEQNFWLASELEIEVTQGAYNIGLGLERFHADGYVRTAFAAGPSILAYNTALDRRGSTGFFLHLTPIGLRWPIRDHGSFGLDPLSFAVVAPVLTGIPLIKVEYRTTLYGEASW